MPRTSTSFLKEREDNDFSIFSFQGVFSSAFCFFEGLLEGLFEGLLGLLEGLIFPNSASFAVDDTE